MTGPGEDGALPWRFDDLRALFINCTLKPVSYTHLTLPTKA